MPASTENGLATLNDVPAFVSARSANALISENRPTRIQAETLLILNGLLDELLLTILTSAKSLATDRIKSDGMLRVLNNNLLAKNAVLEAELEYRSYVEGKRAEGAKVPLGLMATSRLDGTDNFPVQSAYKALRTRCQYYSTLADCDDDSAAKDQNIMSSDGRPIATVTPGVAIYVTALLEYVGQHILQNVSRVIERDNSDEASLYDLLAAITEDEQLNPLYNKMSIRQEVTRRIDVHESRRRKLTEDGASRGLKSDARVVKPWHVPTEGDFDEAAGPTLFSPKRASVQHPPRSDTGLSSAASSSRYAHAASSSIGHTDSLRGSISMLRTSSSFATHAADANGAVSPGGSLGKQNGNRASMGLGNAARNDTSASNTGSVGRRQSSERSWSGVFGGIKRRNSFKQGSDPAGSSGRLAVPTDTSATSANQGDSALDPEDDFEALMLSNQTMKVSLTPNRLHTIEVAKKGEGTNVNTVRRRPGTGTVRDDPVSAAAAFGRGPSPSPTHDSRSSMTGDGLASNHQGSGSAERTSTSSATPSDAAAVPRPSSRASLQTAMRPERRTAAPPPSSYRNPNAAALGQASLLSRDVAEQDTVLASAPPPRRSTPRLQPRDDETERSNSTSRDLVDLFKSTPPSASQERFGAPGSDTSSLTDNTTKKSAMSDRVRTLFGRKSTSSTGHVSPSSPHRKTFRSHQRADTKASLEGSQDTYITSSTTNSMEQSRSLVSPNEVPFNRNAASRSSTSTSEHPAASSDAAMETKLTPDVTVIEPEHTPSNGTTGLGIGVAAVAGIGAGAGAGAAGAMAAARSASYGSRSTSYASQAPSATEGGAGQDEASLADDASFASKAKTPDELVSRKVPWGYKRNSTNAGAMIERNGTPTSDRRRSVGYQSSNGHGVLPVRGSSGGAASDNGHGHGQNHATSGVVAATTTPSTPGFDESVAPPPSASSTTRGANAPTAWSGPSGGSGSQMLARRGSLGARPSTANQSRRPSVHLETIQLLAELERAMRNCHSVDECRELVRKAMHSDGTQMSLLSTSRSNGIADEDTTSGDGKAQATSGNAIGTAAGGALAGGAVVGAAATAVLAATDKADSSGDAKRFAGTGVGAAKEGQIRGPEPNLPSADIKPQHVVHQDTSLDKVEQGLVVAWLLGGDDVPGTRFDGQTEGQVDVDASEKQQRSVKGAVPEAAMVSMSHAHASEEEADRHLSLDSAASQGDVRGMASSSVVSLQSNYKDAHDEVVAE